MDNVIDEHVALQATLPNWCTMLSLYGTLPPRCRYNLHTCGQHKITTRSCAKQPILPAPENAMVYGVQAFYDAIMSTASPIAMEYEAIPFLCAIFANLQHYKLLTPRDACTLLRKLCLHSSNPFDSSSVSHVTARESSAARVGAGGLTGSAHMEGSPRCCSPRHDAQFSSPGAALLPSSLSCRSKPLIFLNLSFHNSSSNM